MTNGRDIDARAMAADRMPAAARRTLWAALAGVFAGGLYLYAVRGAAILLDLATVMCL